MARVSRMCATVSERMIRGAKQTFYNKVGVAYLNEDGTIDVVLEAVPVNGRFQIRDWKRFVPTEEQKDDRTTAEKDGDDIPF